MLKNILFATILLLAGAAGGAAQQTPNVEVLRGEVKKLDALVGHWKGTGWIQQEGQRMTFTGTEIVQRKLDGLALLVEGRFTDADGKVVHETLAVLSYDPKKSKYNFRTYLTSGISGDYDFQVTPDGYGWGFQFPGGTIRYAIRMTSDVWFETGEFSRDGKTWIKYFEMKLERVK